MNEHPTVLHAIEQHANVLHNKVAVIDADLDCKLTYGELWLSVRVFARRLIDEGVKKGDRVVVRVGSLLETVVAQFAINLAGAVYCPVEKVMKKLKVLDMMEYFDSTMLISSEHIDFNGKWIDIKTVCFEGEPLEVYTLPCLDDINAIVFTTGTTGKAKGVIHNFNLQLVNGRVWRDVYGITEKDVFMWVNPLDRVHGVRSFIAFLTIGGTVVHYSNVILCNEVFNTIGKYHVTTIFIQSFALAILLDAAPDAFGEYKEQIRLMAFGGGAMPESHKKWMCELLPNTKLYTHYNMTEVAFISCLEFSKFPGKPNCVGKPYREVELCLVDGNGNIMKKTTRDNFGSITFRTNGMMLGYWKDPDLTKDVLKAGYLHVTDVGYMDDDGYLYLLGRSDDVIVSGGFKIAPYEIEDVVMQMNGISECVCVATEDRLLGGIPKLFVVMKSGFEFSAREILMFLSERMESYKRPRSIIELDEFPRVGRSSKIDRVALRMMK
jgi:long-chain acyl-CoA synthetase